MNIIKQYKKILILAVLIRLILMPFLFHPDIKSQYFHGQFLSQGVWDIYSYLKENKAGLPYKDTFNYPPLTYYFFGGWYFITQPVLGDELHSFLNYWGENPYFSQDIFRQMLILKIPYLLADLGLGIFLAMMVEESFAKRTLTLWFFNPINLYIIYGLSNFDILPAFFSVLSLYLFQKKKTLTSGLSLGAGIAFKVYPALFFPFLAWKLLEGRKIKELVIFSLATAAIPIISVIPSRADFLSISGSGLFSGIQNPLFIAVYLLIILLPILFKNDKFNVVFLSLLTLLLISCFSKIHPQWLLWSMPFLIYFMAKDLKLALGGFLLFIGFIFLILSFNDEYLNLGILSPIYPNIYGASMLSQNIDSLLKGLNFDFISRVLFILFGAGFAAGVFWRKGKESLNFRTKNILLFQLILDLGLGIIMTVLVVFYIGHKSLNFKTDQTVALRSQIYSGNPMSESFVSSENNLYLIYVNLSNQDLKNTDPLTFTLFENGVPERKIDLSGANIGFETQTKFQFPEVADSRNANFQVSLVGERPKDSDSVEAALNPEGNFIISGYSKVGFRLALLNSLSIFAGNFWFDKVFALVYILIMAVLVLVELLI